MWSSSNAYCGSRFPEDALMGSAESSDQQDAFQLAGNNAC